MWVSPRPVVLCFELIRTEDGDKFSSLSSRLMFIFLLFLAPFRTLNLTGEVGWGSLTTPHPLPAVAILLDNGYLIHCKAVNTSTHIFYTTSHRTTKIILLTYDRPEMYTQFIPGWRHQAIVEFGECGVSVSFEKVLEAKYLGQAAIKRHLEEQMVTWDSCDGM